MPVHQLRIEKGVGLANELIQWESQLVLHGDNIHWGDLWVRHQGDSILFIVSVYLGDVSADYIEVQLYADPENQDSSHYCTKMQKANQTAWKSMVRKSSIIDVYVFAEF